MPSFSFYFTFIAIIINSSFGKKKN